MIEVKNPVFALHSEYSSYLFRVSPHGQLEHIHFGTRIDIDDAEAMLHSAGRGWGVSVLYDETDAASSLDTLPLEWSGVGRGDYREPPLLLRHGDTPIPTDFRYEGYAILPGNAPMLCSLPQADTPTETLEIRLRQGKLLLLLHYAELDGVFLRRATLVNEGEEAITVDRLMSFCLDLDGSYTLHSFDGNWLREAEHHTGRINGAMSVIGSRTGASSHRHNPGFLLAEAETTEEYGKAYAFNLFYSGSHYSAAEPTTQNLTRVLQGIQPAQFSVTLNRGERFEAPQALLAFSEWGFGGLSQLLHVFINSHVVPKAWRFRPRPILFNSWEGCGFAFDHDRLVRLGKKAAALGCELFVLDDGWFGKRNNDRAGLGDYTVNPEKLPYGLDGLGNALNALGLEFGLWMEPEAVNPDSDLYRAHPEWAIRDELTPVYGRHELLLDLSIPAVRDYLVERIGGILDSAPIRYVKWDMNRHSTALGAKQHDCILGLYEVLHRIFDSRPDILLESCSSGGNRFDLGMLCFSPQIWVSDNTDAIDRLRLQNDLSYLYPRSAMGSHVSAVPNAQTLRSVSMHTRGCVASFGVLGYELDLELLTEEEEEEIRRQISFYRARRRLLQFGAFSRLNAEEGAFAWQCSDASMAVAGLFHRLVPAAPGYERLRLMDMSRFDFYTLRFSNGDRLCSCSGAALMSGVTLPPRFVGTGTEGLSRLGTDFSAELYLAEME